MRKCIIALLICCALIMFGCTGGEPGTSSSEGGQQAAPGSAVDAAEPADVKTSAQPEAAALEQAKTGDKPAAGPISHLEQGVEGLPEGTAGYYVNLAIKKALEWQSDAKLKSVSQTTKPYKSWTVAFMSDTAGPGVWYSAGWTEYGGRVIESAGENKWMGGDRANEIVYFDMAGTYIEEWSYNSDAILLEAEKIYGQDSVMLLEIGAAGIQYHEDVDPQAPQGASMTAALYKLHLTSGSSGYWSSKRMYFDGSTGRYLGMNQK